MLVVRPLYPTDSPLWRIARGSGVTIPSYDDLPGLEFLEYRVSGTRGGGFEPEIEIFDLARIERKLYDWAPDILLVMDPDMFALDTFRVPGFNMLRHRPIPPVAIASFTSFCLEAVLKMPEYWWLRFPPLRELFVQVKALPPPRRPPPYAPAIPLSPADLRPTHPPTHSRRT